MTLQAAHDPFRAHGHDVVPVLPERGGPGPVRLHAHVDRYPPFVNAGAEWMLHAMLRHLVRRGHSVTVSTALEHRAVVDGVEVWPAGHADELAAEADGIVGHLLWTREVVALAERHRKPLLYVVHNDFQLQHWAIHPRRVSALVFNSEWVAAAAGWRSEQIIVRPPCLVADYETGVDPADAEFVTLVNMNPDKGGGVFYELARRMPGRRFLAVCGAYGNQMAPRARDTNVEWQPPTGRMVEDVYRRTRLLLVPSRYESWGRAAVEACCSGIPVIAHPTPGLREALGDGATFADRKDVGAWAAAIERLDDPAEYRRASEAARARALHLDRVAAEDLAAWEQLALRCAPTTEEAHP